MNDATRAVPASRPGVLRVSPRVNAEVVEMLFDTPEKRTYPAHRNGLHLPPR